MERTRHAPTSDTVTRTPEYHRVDLSVLSNKERRLLAAWNTTQQAYPLDLCVPQLVARQAHETPNAPAVVMSDQVLTYRELNQRANRLAHHLQALDVGPEILVAVCLERSPDLVVALLAVLKAGGAYLPLDASFPIERLATLLEDARPCALVTRASLPGFPVPPGIRVVRLDADADALAQRSEAEPASAVSTEHLAYVIYTSGSTGQPKGVEICHSSLLNLVYWHQRAYGITARERATQLASPSFDATGWELWPYLTCGARVYLADEETRLDPVGLRNWLVAQGITVTFLPTPLAERVMGLEWPESSALRLMLTGGDTLHRFPPPRLPFTLVNNYGPTEATVVTTCATVPPAIPASAGGDRLPPIGRPIANAEIYLLDDRLREVPIGEPGELYIGGAGLARGYRHRPALTQERFVAHPFSALAGARLYRTGDLARYLSDGQIAFLGRADGQIKVHGYRIEPGEITWALNQHPSIQASYVVAREDTPGEKRLVAYIVPIPEMSIRLRSLRESLAALLPDYMIPAVYVLLEGLPLTPNGKVDRAALPVPDLTNTLHSEVVAEPTTPVEERLVTIVATTLGLNPTQVGIDDDFFLLGGHSLLGTQVITLVADAFGVELSLRTLFEAPTVRELAVAIEAALLRKVEALSDAEVARLLS